mgnify:CR=1 FL=1
MSQKLGLAFFSFEEVAMFLQKTLGTTGGIYRHFMKSLALKLLFLTR